MTDRTHHASAGVDTASADSHFARDGAAWSEVTALDGDTYRIRLGGLLRPTWMLGVCNGLATHNISIERAHARRLNHDASWIAELHVITLPGASDPLQLQLIAFAESGPVEDNVAPLLLRSYELLESSDHGGTLRLSFNARDSVGLLGSLLAAFSSLSLLPVEMHIETRDSEAWDCLWLSAAGSAKPTSQDNAALDALLRRTIRH